ncbi:hypothetical protein Tco_1006288 [Tanacetum coccineum]|uniref:GT-1/4-like C-terminal domain-containing protein n=1 Tax=Tanacetum coccineum TaxID=301880 RepID=A0ABQ5FHG7_9ASTR
MHCVYGMHGEVHASGTHQLMRASVLFAHHVLGTSKVKLVLLMCIGAQGRSSNGRIMAAKWGEYTRRIGVDEFSIKICHYDEPECIDARIEEKTFYTEEDLQEFLKQCGLCGLQEIDGYICFNNMDDLRLDGSEEKRRRIDIANKEAVYNYAEWGLRFDKAEQ